MTFAQTSAAEGVPAVLQNGDPELHIVNTVPGALASTPAFTLSKSFAINPPPGKYHVIGSIQVQGVVSGQAGGISIAYDGVTFQNMALTVTPTLLSYIPVAGAFVVTTADRSLAFFAYTGSNTLQVVTVDLILIRVA